MLLLYWCCFWLLIGFCIDCGRCVLFLEVGCGLLLYGRWRYCFANNFLVKEVLIGGCVVVCVLV